MFVSNELKMLAREYEDDLRYLIYRTSSGDYDSVLESFYVLADLYCLIGKLEMLDRCKVNVPPPTAISNPQQLERFNVAAAEKRHLKDFLHYIEQHKGKRFDELMHEHIRTTNTPTNSLGATA